MFCPQCGSRNDAEARYCESCGKGLGHADARAGRPTVAVGPHLGHSILGLLKVVASFFVLPLLAVLDVEKELRKIGFTRSASRVETTPTPFLSWVLVAFRILVPIGATLWIVVWGSLVMSACLIRGGFLGTGELLVILGAMAGAFVFVWIAELFLDVMSIQVNINQKVTEIADRDKTSGRGTEK